MAKWYIDPALEQGEPSEHTAPLKLTHTSTGVLLESAYDLQTAGGPSPDLADGIAKLELSFAELDLLRILLGAGRLTFVNRLGIALHSNVRLLRTPAGPHYEVTIERERSFHGMGEIQEDELPTRPWDRSRDGNPTERSITIGKKLSEALNGPIRDLDGNPIDLLERPKEKPNDRRTQAPKVQPGKLPKRGRKPGRKRARKGKASRTHKEPGEGGGAGAVGT